MTDVFARRRTRNASDAAAVTALLGQGEGLIAVIDTSLCGLIRDTVPRRYRQAEPWRLSDILAFPLTAVVAVLERAEISKTAVLRWLVAPLRGRPFRGGWRSQAGRFVIAVRTLPSRSGSFSYDNSHALLAFTDRRVLIVYARGSHRPRLGEFPREQLREVRIRHWTFSSRVDLTFADGSLVAVEAGQPEAEALARLVTS
jgi:hypothetical protein